MPNFTPDPLSISLWGPSGSGKTWLVTAFLARVRELNAVSKKQLALIFSEQGRYLPSCYPKPHAPTESLSERLLLFTRKSSRQGSYNNYSHWLRITDYPGEVALEMLTSSGGHSVAQVAFEDSDLIIVALDHGLLEKASNRTSQKSKIKRSKEQSITLEEYTEYVGRLLDQIGNAVRETDKRWLAICLMKADLFPDPRMDPWKLVETHFGKQMLSTIQEFQQHQSILLKPFVVSSAGFLDGIGSDANFYKGNIKDKTRWSPWNVEAPIFWALESLERQRLKTNSPRLIRQTFYWFRKWCYIPYPTGK